MTTAELCDYLGISRETLQRWLRAGLLGDPDRASNWRGGARVWTDQQVEAVSALVGRPRRVTKADPPEPPR